MMMDTSIQEEPNPISTFVRQARTIIFRPSRFFAQMPTTGGYSAPLVFGLICHWVGSALAYFSTYFTDGHPPQMEGVEALSQYSGALELAHFWSSASIVLDPFVALFQILFTASMLSVSTRILVPTQEGNPAPQPNFEISARIASYALAPSLLNFIPGFSGWIWPTWAAICTVSGIRSVYRISWRRSFAIFVLPSLLTFGLIAFVLFVMFAGAFSLILQALIR